MRNKLRYLWLALPIAVLLFFPWGHLRAQTAHNITLTFPASVTPGVNYNMYRATVTGGPYTKLNATPFVPTSYVDTTGVGGTKYFYVQTSICTAACPAGISGESGFSPEASATFLGNPAAAASLAATAN